MNRPEITAELETFRQLVIAARRTPEVEQSAEASLERLRGLYGGWKALFTAEDVRWINVLKRFLQERYMPMGIGEPQDVAQAVVFLAPPLAKFITVASLDIGGTLRGLI